MERPLKGSLLLFLAVCLSVHAADTHVIRSPYTFIDEVVEIRVSAKFQQLPIHISTLTTTGFGPKQTMTASVTGGVVKVKPLVEGIHVLHLGDPVNRELRFLAMDPPASLDPELVKTRLPRVGTRLLGGKPFSILAMGDSVTGTGDYPAMLVRMLQRATGNLSITQAKRAYPGRSIDATVRHFERDTKALQPHLGLLMYGLNDQICSVPQEAYLAQYEWVSKRMASRFGADMVLLQPTPHINVTSTDREGRVQAPAASLRTLGYAGAVTRLGKALSTPVAQTFHAIWGVGAGGLLESATALWPLYPRSYGKPFSSLVESGGIGDMIHPNALGHLQLAKAVYAAIGLPAREQPLEVSGMSRWGGGSVVSTLTITNRSGARRKGRIEIHAPTRAVIAGGESMPYDLDPGASLERTIRWPQVAKPEDLLRFPYDYYLSRWQAPLTVVDFSGKGNTPLAVTCPFSPALGFARKRTVVDGSRAEVELFTPEGVERVPVSIPEGPQVGRIPLLQKRSGVVAAAEAVYTRFGAVTSGEGRRAVGSPLASPARREPGMGLRITAKVRKRPFPNWPSRLGRRGSPLLCVGAVPFFGIGPPSSSIPVRPRRSVRWGPTTG
ncbi:MAG: SGNH/GDSL hydrolase family protein [Planctomycetota bacterium]